MSDRNPPLSFGGERPNQADAKPLKGYQPLKIDKVIPKPKNVKTNGLPPERDERIRRIVREELDKRDR